MSTDMKDYIVSTSKIEWEPLNEEGVDTKGISVKVLRFDEDTKRPPSFLLKFEAGAEYPFHNHPAVKKFLCLKALFVLMMLNWL